MAQPLPITVVVTTLNEGHNIARCLQSLAAFDQVIVVDSKSEDDTVDIARGHGADVVLYSWNGLYPKKRGWCLENLNFKHDWVFWVDADEVVTDEAVIAIRAIFSKTPKECGFFVPAYYVWRGKILRHGMCNNKVALFNRHKMIFPPVDDLDIPGMGEIEGHYQPVLRCGVEGKVGFLPVPILHYAYDDLDLWDARHQRYARWEAEMIKRSAWPKDPILWRQCAKIFLRRCWFRPHVMFLYSYIFKFGFLDGRAGYEFALSRKLYCKMVARAMGA